MPGPASLTCGESPHISCLSFTGQGCRCRVLPTFRSSQEPCGMKSSYWAEISERRLTRRRTVGMMAAGTAAAILAACGGGSGSSSGASGASSSTKNKDSSGLLTTPEVTTKNAVGGGTWQYYLTADVDHFDPMDA